MQSINGSCTFGNNLIATSPAPSSASGFYISTAYTAMCAGNATQWNICYYAVNTDIKSQSFFAVYRPSYNATFLSLVSGSATMITINSTNIISNYTCSNFTVPTFQVQSGDVIASCIHASGNTSLRLGVIGKANNAITLRRNFSNCGSTTAGAFPISFDTSINYANTPVAIHVQLGMFFILHIQYSNLYVHIYSGK